MPTSDATRRDAERLGIPLTTLDETPELDLTVDGADEIAPDLSLIKGGGGALLREKIVAAASARMIVIADESKWVPVLGRFPLPIEVEPFGLGGDAPRGRGGAAPPPARRVRASLRRTKDGHAFVTDGGHWILDGALQRIADPKALAARLSAIPGVIEHGLFIGLATAAILAGSDGRPRGRAVLSRTSHRERSIVMIANQARRRRGRALRTDCLRSLGRRRRGGGAPQQPEAVAGRASSWPGKSST